MKRRSKEVKPEIDLGVINMTPVECTPLPNALKFTEESIQDDGIPVGIHRLYPDVEIPAYATQLSACFDLRAYLGNDIVCVDTYNRILMHTVRAVGPLPERDYQRGINIEPGECVFIPTGLIFDIPEGFKITLSPRSGISGKKHLRLANCIGIIDEDYIKPTMVLIFNDSEQRQGIAHGDRIAQAEVVPVYRASFFEIDSPPELKSNRLDGLGHTGTN